MSTGINPISYPLFDLPATVLTRLPDTARHAELKRIAALAYTAPATENVVAAPGTQILLPRIAALVPPGRALVLGPTYAEHRRALTLAGHDARDVKSFDDLYAADIAVVVNPNNPDGRIIGRGQLLDLADSMRANGGLLIVDEAFGDLSSETETLAPEVGKGGLVVLRSFGKFFGLAGVRLGFAIASTNVASKLEAELGPWAVAGPALEYGIKALADKEWRDSTRNRLRDAAQALDRILGRGGIAVSGGTSLFRFVQRPDAPALFTFLGGQGILVRSFSDRPDSLRVGLPKPEDIPRLEAAIQSWASKTNSPPLALGSL